jgi:glycogen phosphorylase
VHVDHVELDDSLAELGTERTVEAIVALGEVAPDDVEVQLLHGPAGQGQELNAPEVVVLEAAGAADDAHLRYRGRFTCQRAGRYGITVRIVPKHPTLVNPVELGKVAWG